MRIKIAYGMNGLSFAMPENAKVTILEPKYQPPLPNVADAMREALANPIGTSPLRHLVRSTDTVGIVFSDITRPVPNHILIPAIRDAISHVPDSQILLFNATGTHRTNTEEELREVLGEDVAGGYRIIQNDANDRNSHMMAGVTASGNEVWLHREFLSCDVRILTGFIEPHFFAGFSGGGKAVMPGLARMDTIQRNHSVRHLDNSKATWALTYGNPLWEEIREAAMMTNPTFLLNVSLNRDKMITGIFAGELNEAHAIGCDFVRKAAMVPAPKPFDIVITSNSGYPLDRNLYQAVKGMSAAAQIVKPGGTIIIASECRDGLPEDSPFSDLLAKVGSPRNLLDLIHRTDFDFPEMWQAQILTSIVCKADIHLHSDMLTAEQIRRAWLTPCANIEDTVARLLLRYGADADICVLPEGPLTAPYVDNIAPDIS